MSSRRLLVAILLAVSVLACREEAEEAPPQVAEVPPPRDAATERMVRALDLVLEQSDALNRFTGTRELREDQAALAAFGANPPAIDACELNMAIGEHLLRLGRIDEALAAMQAAERLLGDLPAATRQDAEPVLRFRLGVAWMRKAEADNCVALHGPDSCRFPLAGGGVHVDKTGADRALDCFTRVLAGQSPDSSFGMTLRWLITIAAQARGEWPAGLDPKLRIDPPLAGPRPDFPRFFDRASRCGVDTFDLSGGAAVDDFDGDGLLDIVVSTSDPAGPMHYFRNRGDGGFEDRSQAAGFAGLRGGLNLVSADWDGDGDVDILVLRGAWMDREAVQPRSLLTNDGKGRFVDRAFESGLAASFVPSQCAAFADYDDDGDLDLFIGAESRPESPLASQLWRNEGDGHFVDVAREAGVENLLYAKGCAFADYDGDGDPDLYVSNLAGPNRLYRNLGNGRFEDVAEAAGVRGPHWSFPCWFFDYDGDGRMDLYVAAYRENVGDTIAGFLGRPHQGEAGRLFRNRGDGSFEDRTREAGLDIMVPTMGAGLGDLDGDGRWDFYLGTGFPAYEALFPNLMFRNVDGRRFEDVTLAGGFGHLQKGHAVVFADLDNDGDQEVFEQMGGAYRGDAFRNALYVNPGFGRHGIKVLLEGGRRNRFGLGATVQVDLVEDSGVRRSVHHLVGPGGSFGSRPMRAEIGCGEARRIERLLVRWPGGHRTTIVESPPLDAAIAVREDTQSWRVLPLPRFELPP